MANETLAKAVDQMSDEEIQALMAELTKGSDAGAKGGEQDNAQPAGAATAQPAFDQEAFATSVASKITPPKAETRATTPEEFDKETYVKMFLDDPRKAQRYMERTQYGAEISPVLPQLFGTIGALVNEVTALKTQMAEAANPSIREHRGVLDEIVKARGWAPSAQSYEDALMIAQASGKIQQKEEKAARVTAPPRSGPSRGAQDEDSRLDAILKNASQLTDAQLDELAVRAGIVKQAHLSGN